MKPEVRSTVGFVHTILLTQGAKARFGSFVPVLLIPAKTIPNDGVLELDGLAQVLLLWVGQRGLLRVRHA